MCKSYILISSAVGHLYVTRGRISHVIGISFDLTLGSFPFCILDLCPFIVNNVVADMVANENADLSQR